MPLDAGVKALLDSLAAAKQPPLDKLTPQAARALYRRQIEAAAGKTIEVGKVEDLKIPGPGGEISVRVYTPAADAKGCLLWFHGGGFVIGDLSTHDDLCRRFCTNDLLVIAVDYRLAPEHRYPAQVDDALAALEWTVTKYRGLKLAVGGDSAGGALAAILAQREGAKDDPRIAYQILFCPWLDLFANTASGSRNAFGTDHLLELSSLDWSRRHYLGNFADPQDVSISPLKTRSLDDLPPAYILTAECDPLRDDGKTYAHRLTAAGVSVTYCEAPGMIHNFFCMAEAIPAGGPAIEEAAAAYLEAVK